MKTTLEKRRNVAALSGLEFLTAFVLLSLHRIRVLRCRRFENGIFILEIRIKLQI